MAGRLKRYHGEGVYELIWLLKLALPCQLAVEGILQEAVDVRRGWHENGQLERKGVWKDGQRDGLHRGWHANGKLRDEVAWKDGQEHGLLQAWDANGRIRFQAEHKNGKVCGRIRYHY
jgi:hypothetical protein